VVLHHHILPALRRVDRHRHPHNLAQLGRRDRRAGTQRGIHPRDGDAIIASAHLGTRLAMFERDRGVKLPIAGLPRFGQADDTDFSIAGWNVL